jgi:hypothetical protein
LTVNDAANPPRTDTVTVSRVKAFTGVLVIDKPVLVNNGGQSPLAMWSCATPDLQANFASGSFTITVDGISPWSGGRQGTDEQR